MPNVILILIDTLRRDFLSPYSDTRGRTPGFERLAQLGTTFDNAYLTSYPCMPARRDLWTGRYEFPWRGWGPLEPTDRSLPALLTTAGIHTGLVTDHYHLFEHGSGNYHFGFSSWDFIRGQEKDAWKLPRQPILWPAPPFTKVHRAWEQYWANTAAWRTGAHWQSETLTFAAQTFQHAADWVEAYGDTTPFFLLIDCFDPHEPFDPPLSYRHRNLTSPPPAEYIPWPIYGPATRYTPEELLDIQQLYASELDLVDTWLDHFLDRIERLGRLHDTLLIVTTDHGYLFGEHGMIGKPSTFHGDSNLYQEIATVPFFVIHPDAPGGQRSSELVQIVDIYPTILEAFSIPQHNHLHGYSLLPLLFEKHPSWPRRYAYYAKYGEAINVTDGHYTLFQWPPASANTPLYWYSASPPDFLKPRSLGPYEPCLTRYPADWPRGPMHTALYDILNDPHQQHNLATSHSQELLQLQNALRSWLEEIQAPSEQFGRLGMTSPHMTGSL